MPLILRLLVSIPIVGKFIVIPILEALTGKTRRMPNERGEVVPKQLLRGRALRASLFLLALVAFFFIYQSFSSRNDKVEVKASTTDIGKIKGKFEEIVARSSDNDLVGIYQTLSFDPMDNLPTTNSKLKQRIRISEKLLGSSSPEMRKKGVSFALSSNLNLGMLYLREREPIPLPILDGLRKQLDSSMGKGDSTIQALNSIAKAAVKFSEFEAANSKSPTSANGNGGLQIAVPTLLAIADEIKQAAEFSKNKIEAASLLSQFAAATEARIPESEIGYYSTVRSSLMKHFLESELTPVNELGRSWKKRTLESHLKLPTIDVTLPRESQRTAVEANKNRIIELLRTDDSLNDKWPFICGTVHTILRAGHNETAKELLDLCKEKITTENPGANRSKLLKLSKWLVHLNQEFDCDELDDAFGDRVAFGENTLPIRIIIYAGPKSKTQLLDQMSVMVRLAARSMENNSASLTVIYAKDDVGQSREDKVIEYDMKVANNSENLNLWVIDPNSPSGAKHFEKYPKVEFPFVVLLDTDLKIVSINPDLYEYERQLVAAHKRKRAHLKPIKN